MSSRGKLPMRAIGPYDAARGTQETGVLVDFVRLGATYTFVMPALFLAGAR